MLNSPTFAESSPIDYDPQAVKEESGKIVPFFQFESLPTNGRLTHGVLTRRGGQSPAPFKSLNLSESVADDRVNVMANRALAYSAFGRSNETLVHAHLVHGRGVVQVAASMYGQYVGPADALITDQPGCGLTMNYADCSPVLLFDPVNQAIGLGHSGWKGAVLDLPGAMVSAMERSFGSRPQDLLAAVGPTIGPCCYQIGPQVIELVQGAFDHEDRVMTSDGDGSGANQGEDRAYFDLARANQLNLERAGLRSIEVSDLCTACRTDLFFSHRAEGGHTGRFGALLILSK